MTNIEIAINEFIKHCRFEKNLSPKTIKAYVTDLSQLRQFLLEKNYPIEISEITKNELKAFLEKISNLKPKSIKRKIATIKAMFNYLEFEDKLLVNPMRKMKIQIREARNLPKIMNITEIKSILNSAYKIKDIVKDTAGFSYKESLRNILVIELLFGTGARVSEIADLKRENIDIMTGAITIRGKGNKERILQICNQEVLKILREYCSLFRKEIFEECYLLINRFGKKLSDQSIRAIVKHLSVKAGIGRKVTPHMFRHSFATLLLERDVDIKYIQSFLGHSSIMTTQIYTHVNRAKQKQILRTKHPRKDFSMFSLASGIKDN